MSGTARHLMLVGITEPLADHADLRTRPLSQDTDSTTTSTLSKNINEDETHALVLGPVRERNGDLQVNRLGCDSQVKIVWPFGCNW